MTIYLGGDVSKGYADFCATDEEGSVLLEERLDDTAAGHSRLRAVIAELTASEAGDVSFVCGVEATGGMERNWLGLFQKLREDRDLSVYQLNPFVLHKFTEQQLHHNKTDPLSAQALAEYLRRGMSADAHPFSGGGPDEGLRTLERTTKKRTKRMAQLKTEFRALMQVAHPELIQHCRTKIHEWVLRLVREYPTAAQLAQADPERLAEIPFVTPAKAKMLIANAEESVACQTDPDTALTLEIHAEELLRLIHQVKRLKAHLWNRIKDREAAQILRSIGGIGEWSATVLLCEIGDISRFPSASQLVAFAGLDSRRNYSGDMQLERPISKRGNSRIRSILYTAAQTAIKDGVNPPIRAFYDRLRDRGKHHMTAITACMRKLLSIVYGCWSKGERFDPHFERAMKARMNGPEHQANGAAVETSNGETNSDLKAPISWREARRRKEATQPQESKDSRVRGQKAASS